MGSLHSPLGFVGSLTEGFKTPTAEIVGIEFVNPTALKKAGANYGRLQQLVPVQELNINAGAKRLAVGGATAGTNCNNVSN
jgi:hypothetical protein